MEILSCRQTSAPFHVPFHVRSLCVVAVAAIAVAVDRAGAVPLHVPRGSPDLHGGALDLHPRAQPGRLPRAVVLSDQLPDLSPRLHRPGGGVHCHLLLYGKNGRCIFCPTLYVSVPVGARVWALRIVRS